MEKHPPNEKNNARDNTQKHNIAFSSPASKVSTPHNKKRILINIHNTLADLNSALLAAYKEHKQQLSQKPKDKDFSSLQFSKFEKNFGSREASIVRKMIDHLGPTWYSDHVPSIEGAVTACKQMVGYGLDVVLFATPLGTNVALAADIYRWVLNQFKTPDWIDRVVLVSDINKRSIKADYIIDDDESDLYPVHIPRHVVLQKGKKPNRRINQENEDKVNQETTNKNNPNNNNSSNKNNSSNNNDSLVNDSTSTSIDKKQLDYTLLIYGRPWNTSGINYGRLFSTWSNWKVEMTLEESNDIPHFRHGSPTSLDIDLYYLFPSLPDGKDCFTFCSGAVEDRNIIVVDDEFGVIKACHKGNPDECNNSLLMTYQYHQQRWPCPVKRKKQRIVPLKATTVAMRNILGKVILAEDAEEVTKMARISIRQKDFQNTIAALEFVSFEKLVHGLSPSDYKNIAFQMGQSMGLIEGKEHYTKTQIGDEYKELNVFLMRDPEALSYLKNLSNFRDKLLHQVKQTTFTQHKEHPLLHFSLSPEKINGHLNFFQIQSRGMVIELRHPGHCVLFPLTHSRESDPDWPADPAFEIIYNSVKKKSSYISIWKWNDLFVVSDENGFETSDTQRFETIQQAHHLDLTTLSFEKYWHVFVIAEGPSSNEEIFLVALRNRISHDLVLDRDQLEKEANLASLKILPSRLCDSNVK